MRILMRAYTLATGETVSGIKAVSELEVPAPSPPAPAPLPCAGGHKVALPAADTLRCWWHVWQEGHIGYQPLCDYFSQTKPKVGKPEFLNPTSDPQKVWRKQHMLWELEKQIGRGHQTKKENADWVSMYIQGSGPAVSAKEFSTSCFEQDLLDYENKGGVAAQNAGK
ncbi:hypothetical protein WJX77_010301 [Trebouxia sp. C0004]